MTPAEKQQHRWTHIADVIRRIECEGLSFDFGSASFPYLCVSCDNGICNVTGQPLSWEGRKWPISEYMTDGEIVQTAFKALLTALEHEAREKFTYRGVSVFDPHYDIEKLVALRLQPDALKERDAA